MRARFTPGELRRFVVALAAAALAALLVAGALLFGATPASAHAELIGSTPAADERLETAPTSIELRFSEELIALGAAVSIVDADGTEWLASGPEVSGTTVTATLRPGMGTARYELRWQVVSADGHPISGIVVFAVGDAPLDAPAAGAPASGSAGSGGDASPVVAEVVRTIGVGLGAAVIAGGAYLTVALLRTRRRARVDAAS